MMKKLIIAMSIIPALACAVTPDQEKSMLQENIKQLEKMGLPTPGSGVQLVPSEKISMPDWQKKQFMAQASEQKSKGYVNQSSDRAFELIHIEAQIKKRGILNTVSSRPYHTELHTRVEDIPFAYSFIGVPKDSMVKFFGIAPVGAYVKDPQAGWTGGVEFFQTSFAHCAYTENSFMAGNGAVQVDEDMAKNDVNGKVTLIDVEGNKSTGFLYQVNWFDNNYNRNLECASQEYSSGTLQETIELAKKIDSQP